MLMVILVFLTVGTVCATENSSSSTVTGVNSDLDLLGDSSSVRSVNEVYVNTTGSDDNIGSVDSPYATINKGISSVNASDNAIIYLSEGTFQGENNTNLAINLAHKNYNGTLTFVGVSGKTSIDGEGASPIFASISADSIVTFINITFANGKNNFGGAITSKSLLTIKDCVFKDNYATGSVGGAIYQSGNNLYISDTVFTNNSANGYGGAIYTSSLQNANLTDCVFINCSARSTYCQGAAANIDAYGTVYCVGNTVINSSSLEDSYDGSFSISAGNKGYIINNTFINCTNIGTSYSILQLKGNNYVSGNKFINSSNILGNIYNNGYMNVNIVMLDNKTVNVTSTTFILTANVTDIDGNIITADSYSGVVFYLNGTQLGSDFAKIKKGVASLVYTGLVANGFYNVTGTYSRDYGNSTMVPGTLVVNISQDPIDLWVSVTGSDLAGNGSQSNPFKTIGYAINYGFSKSLYPTIHISEGIFSGVNNTNLSYSNLGVLTLIGANYNKTIIDGSNSNWFFKFGSYTKVDMKNITFTKGLLNKYVSGLYGLIYSENSLNMSDCIFNNNHQNRGSYAISIGSNSIINNLTYTNNRGPLTVGANSKIDNSYFANNYNDNYYGGAIDTGNLLNVSNSKFINNLNNRSGGGVGGAIYGSIISVNNYYEGNNATGSAGAVSGLYYSENDTFINNCAVNFGAAAASSNTHIDNNVYYGATIVGSKFINNSATNGGAIQFYGGDIINTTFINNIATVNGGAIIVDTHGNYFTMPNVTFSNCTFKDNNAKNGKDIYIKESSAYYDICGKLFGFTITYNNLTTQYIADTVTANINHYTGAIIGGGHVEFYLDDIYMGKASVVNGIASLDYLGFKNGTYNLNGKYNFEDSGDNIINGTINVALKPLLNNVSVYVSDLVGDDINGNGSLSNPFKTIRRALNYAYSQSTTIFVYILEGIYSGDGNTNIELSCTVNITITGSGINKTILCGNQTNDFFKIVAGDSLVTIENMTIVNGSVLDAIAIYPYTNVHNIHSPIWILEGANVCLNNVYFEGNTGTLGGAILNSGNLKINNCSLVRNGFSSYGGGVFNNGTLIADNCYFFANYAYRGSNIFTTKKVTLKNSLVEESYWYSASHYGNIVGVGDDGALTLINTTLQNLGRTGAEAGRTDATTSKRGYIYIGGIKNVQAYNSTFRYDKNLTADDILGGYYGSAWEYNYQDVIIFDNCTFENIRYISNVGFNSYQGRNGTVIINNCDLTNVQKVLTTNTFGILNITNCYIPNNSVVSWTGAVSGVINVNYNWWGNNSQPVYFVNNVGYSPDNWLVLFLSVGNLSGVVQDVVLGFVVSDGVNVSDYVGVLPGRDFVLSTSNGVVSPGSGCLFNVVGAVLSGVPGGFVVSGVVDNVTVSCVGDLALGNVVTNGTFFQFFDEFGNLRSVFTGDNLTFVGDFSGLNVSVINIGRSIDLFGFNATLWDIAFNVSGSGVSVCNFTIVVSNVSGLFYAIGVSGDNVSLVGNVVDFVSSGSNVDAYGILAVDSFNLKLIGNVLDYCACGNGTVFNMGFSASNCTDLLLFNNVFNIRLPSCPVVFSPDYTSSTTYSIGVDLDDCDGAIVKDNNMSISYNGFVSGYDSLYGLSIRGSDDVVVYGNNISTYGHNYVYSLVLGSGDNFQIVNNSVDSVSVGYYANAVQISGPATGEVTRNNISAVAKNVAYPLYSEGYSGKIKGNYTKNSVYGRANSVFALRISGTEELVLGNFIIADGNYTIGVGSTSKVAVIRNNTIITKGLGLGNKTGGDSIVDDNTGIKVRYGLTSISANVVNTTGEYSVVILTSNNTVCGNDLVASYYTGDASVSYVLGSNVVANNTPVMYRVILTVDNVVMFYKDGTGYVVKLTTVDGRPLVNQTVTFNIYGMSYNRTTDGEGKASLGLNLGPGFYLVNVLFKGTNIYAKVNASSNVTIKSTIDGNDITKIYKNGTQYYATFLKSDGTPLANRNVTFNIYGVFYKRPTNNMGVARLNINLHPGEYIITAIHPDNGQMFSNNITVLSSITGKNIVKYYRNGTQYYATFLNSDGTPLVNRNVTFNIYGVMYTRPTNNMGVAKLNINLHPGKYIITVIHPDNGQMFSNNIKVLPTLVGKDLTKKYGSTAPYEVRLVDGKGLPIGGASIRLNIYGVFYNRLTDSNGIARLNINLMPGVYIVSAYYNDAATSNTIKVTN